jgi:hypothetical protein
MKHLGSIVAVFILLLAACAVAPAQQPGSFVSVGTKLTFAKDLGYKQPGAGVAVSAGLAWFQLPPRLYFTEDFEAVHEEKAFVKDGRTVASTTGIQYHFDHGWFARSAVFLGNHSNSAYSKTAARIQAGGGYSFYNPGESPERGNLPLLNLAAVGFAPISDPNRGRGVIFSAESFWSVGRGLCGVRAKGIGSFGSYQNAGLRTRGNYGAVEFGVFLNLSALAGS